MTSTFKNIVARLTPTPSSSNIHNGTGFRKAECTQLFNVTEPEVDGEECLQDCQSCTVKYPSKFSIDEDDKLYGHVKGWETHMVVATGKTDWVRDVADEKGSVMEAVDKSKIKPSNGRLMLSASNIPLPHESNNSCPHPSLPTPTSVLLLPSFRIIDNVIPSLVPDLIRDYINTGPTNTSRLPHPSTPFPSVVSPTADSAPMESLSVQLGADLSISSTQNQNQNQNQDQDPSHPLQKTSSIPSTIPLPLLSRPCPHPYLILLCSQKTRDARCGQSAPLLRRELERHLRPLGLYRDLNDERPGGVGIYFISHVGGHKYSANVIVYRRGDVCGVREEMGEREKGGGGEKENGEDEGKDGEKEGEEASTEAGQCIWLARVRPEDCENIVRFTVLQGKVVKPERQLRGGFDRGRGLASW
ncbi:Sucraseferredoxin-like protein [Aulographum hederae CBS 113979]|uniref:Sucraseferredoxin-like protein n=1 Tax=Aulographum hederae CBS 113979 TaxID=1176131 RepID=A0A6G1GU38_9PEZI|nr:Sucraseferredoxin-like protein [Aulographum hederae CBS 113979]